MVQGTVSPPLGIRDLVHQGMLGALNRNQEELGGPLDHHFMQRQKAFQPVCTWCPEQQLWQGVRHSLSAKLCEEEGPLGRQRFMPKSKGHQEAQAETVGQGVMSNPPLEPQCCVARIHLHSLSKGDDEVNSGDALLKESKHSSMAWAVQAPKEGETPKSPLT